MNRPSCLGGVAGWPEGNCKPPDPRAGEGGFLTPNIIQDNPTKRMKRILMYTSLQNNSSERSASVSRKHSTSTRASVLVVALAALLLRSQPAAAQNAYFQHNLVSDIAGMAENTDTNLVNPWGIASST